MRQIVRDSFFDFTAKREGFTPFMYCDVLNLVTTGVGNLIDAGPNHGGSNTAERARLNNVVSASAMAPAMRLPWKFKAPGWTSKNPLAQGTASQTDIAAAWTATKRQNEVVPDFSQRGGFAYAGLTNLTLDMQGLKDLFARTLDSFDKTLGSRYPGYESWPADAQLAIMSMSWAMGPAFNFPQFKAAVDRLDFNEAAKLSFFRGGGGTESVRSGRNAENEKMFQTAAIVLKNGSDPDILHVITGLAVDAGKAAAPVAIRLGAIGAGVFTGSALLGGLYVAQHYLKRRR